MERSEDSEEAASEDLKLWSTEDVWDKREFENHFAKSLARRPTTTILLCSSGQDDTGFDHVGFEILKVSSASHQVFTSF